MANRPRPEPKLKSILNNNEPIIKIIRLNRYREKINGFLSLKPLKIQRIKTEATITFVASLMIRKKVEVRLIVSMMYVVYKPGVLIMN